MDTPNRSFPRGDLRVSDADRDRAVAELSEHFQTGRLTQEEFEDRSGQALRARTGKELSELFTDLPHGLPPAPASPGSVRRVGRVPVARVVIACVVLAIIAGNVLSTVATFGHTHTVSLGWLVPIVIIGFVFRRNALGRQ
jgi:Domain of unknown function (DUF1707)